MITLTAQNTATGDEIVSEQAQAPDKEHVLDALGKAAAAIRAKLGEDLSSIKRLDTPFGQATTTSLEAFRAYALGDAAHVKALNIPEAEGHYQRAVELDPNFAMAYARLGVVYVNSGQVAKANKYFEKAYLLSKHVSERERLYIAGHYYQNVTGNMPKVIETLQEAIQTYPSQLDSYINLNVAYQSIGQFEQGVPFARKAVQMAPDDAIASENLVGDYVALGLLQDAQAEIDRAHKLGLGGSTDYAGINLVAYFLLGQQDEMQKTLALVAGRPDEFLVIQRWPACSSSPDATVKRPQPRSRCSIWRSTPGLPTCRRRNLSRCKARGLAACARNDKVVEHGLTLDRNKQTQESAVLAAAVCGNGKQALPLTQELSKNFPEDTLIQDVYVPLAKAFVALAEGRLKKRWRRPSRQSRTILYTLDPMCRLLPT